MKALRVLLPVILLAGCQTLADLPPEQKQMQEVHETKLAKGAGFVKTQEWFAKTFTDSKSVIEVQDKEAGVVMGKCIIPSGTVNEVMGTPQDLRLTIKVEVKDNKIRTTCDSFMYVIDGGYRDLVPGAPLEKAKASAQQLVTSLDQYLDKAGNDSF